MSYLVVGCTGCGSPRVVPEGNKTAQCHRCGATTTIEDAIVHARTDELAAAQNALGQVNAKRADGELLTGAVQEAPEARDAIDRALVDARSVSSQRRRVQLAAEGLTEAFETFDEERWVEALARLDIERAQAVEHLQRLRQASLVAEPSHGEFRYLG